MFLEAEYARKILSETLLINKELIFSRNTDLVFGNLERIQDLLVDAFEDNKTGAFALAKSGLNATELFLMNGFRTMFSAKLTALISEWLKQKLMVLVHADAIELVRKFTDPKKKSIYVEKTLNGAAINFGSNSNALGYVIMDESHDAKLFSIFDGEKRCV